jgi:hypothetical protein
VDIPGRSARLLGSTTAVADLANPGSAVARFDLRARQGAPNAAFLLAFWANGADSATSNVLAVAVTDPVPGGGDTYDMPGSYDFVVPTGVTQLDVRSWGAGGSGGVMAGATGGGGAYIEATVDVTPGETLTVYVGEGGAIGDTHFSRRDGGSGGGASGVLRSGTPLVVAGGGGGAGSDGASGTFATGGAGGAGGGAVGEPGQDITLPPTSECQGATGGGGGTQSAGGAGGVGTSNGGANTCVGEAGGPLAGGSGSNSGCGGFSEGPEDWMAGGTTFNGGGGNGGSGYFGGGGGGAVTTYCAAGGGGGSSYAEGTATNVTMVGGSGRTSGEPTAGLGGAQIVNPGFPAVMDASDSHGRDGRVELSWGN